MRRVHAVCAIICNGNGDILLTKRGREPFKGVWALPSGIGESLKGIAPEIGVIEEVRCDLSTSSFKGDYAFSLPVADDPKADMSVVFVGTVNEAEIIPVQGFSQGVRWIAASDIDSINGLAFEHIAVLKRYLQWEKEHPTD